MSVLANLEPIPVFHYFEEICAIPHGSGNTKQISDYLVAFAQAHSLRYLQDSSNNVIIFKPATAGYEASPTVMLQGHMDMVCEKTPDCDINFETDGLRLKLENGIVSAEGTTLGGDDGIALAYALAILAADDIPHPALEAVFTVDEEIGLLGAAAIDCSPLKSRYMLNLDSEEEGYLLVSCAGGATVTCHLPIERYPVTGQLVDLTVCGLLGGHSGTEIDKARGNANVLLGRLLHELDTELDYDLVSVNGGTKDNAIPRRSTAQLVINPEEVDDLTDFVTRWTTILQNEFRISDPNVTIELIFGAQEGEFSALAESDKCRVVSALVLLPQGIQRMSSDIQGLVQTSLNMGILKTSAEEVSAGYSARSSVGSEKDELIHRMTLLMGVLGGTIDVKGAYPAWEYRQNSPLRDLMVQVYTEQYGTAPVVNALHAGVECGLFSSKMPDLDCVSFGPDMKDIHTSEEQLDAHSCKRVWDYTLEVLKRLK